MPLGAITTTVSIKFHKATQEVTCIQPAHTLRDKNKFFELGGSNPPPVSNSKLQLLSTKEYFFQ